MTAWFSVLTILFIIVSAAMVLIILVQRPQGGGLAGAFGGAGGAGTDTVFGGRVGDALTVMTVVAFVLYLGLAVGLNLMDPSPTAVVVPTSPEATATTDTGLPEDTGDGTATDDVAGEGVFAPAPSDTSPPDSDPDS
ncbi:MAG: preprotein translocase subunit SecG [Planctomycetota bacterium]|jgi:preprotein translocase subunit SecG